MLARLLTLAPGLPGPIRALGRQAGNSYRLPSFLKAAVSVPPTRTLSSHEELWGEVSVDYRSYKLDRIEALNKRLTAANRFQGISEREDRSDIPFEAVLAHCKGKYFIHHRGCSLLKTSTADDMIIFQELLWNLRPATIIELGTFTGGSAIWMADMLRLMEINTNIYSMDISLSELEDRVKEIKPANVTFLEGDSYKIEETFTRDMLQSLPHPWLVIEDAHTNIHGIMTHFHPFMKTGDYFIIEDLNPDLPCRLGFGAVYQEEYVRSGPVVLNDLKKFLTEYSQEYAVDSFYTDFFGYNGTWNMHGFIRKM